MTENGALIDVSNDFFGSHIVGARGLGQFLRDDPNAVGFFQAVRLLERILPDRSPGPVRFRPTRTDPAQGPFPMQRTIVIIKPDSVQRRLVGQILQRELAGHGQELSSSLGQRRVQRDDQAVLVPLFGEAADLEFGHAEHLGDIADRAAIAEDRSKAFEFTLKRNMVAVITNGTAVLGLGDIGPEAAMPVMEGKAMLFKEFAGVDAFPICLDTKDPDEIVKTIKRIAVAFGGINLEDIKAPEAFEIERRLKEELDIPVMHDDQHGTAIISAAALLNALELSKKKIDKVKIVISGAGAAAVSCTKLYKAFGAKPENIVMLDSKGVIRLDRPNLSVEKLEFATKRKIDTLKEAMKDADVFVGLSIKDIVDVPMIKSMAKRPIVFAMANPDPEISYEAAIAVREDIIMATGRSDHPNQVNNVLGFPYIFRGALDVRADAAFTARITDNEYHYPTSGSGAAGAS